VNPSPIAPTTTGYNKSTETVPGGKGSAKLKKFSCLHCANNPQFPTERGLMGHLRRKHKNPSAGDTTMNNASRTRAQMLDNHETSKSVAFACVHCEFTCSYKKGLLNHAKQHDSTGRPFACTHGCAQLYFVTKHSRQLHVNKVHAQAHSNEPSIADPDTSQPPQQPAALFKVFCVKAKKYYGCLYCVYHTIYEHSAIRHMQLKHKDKLPKRTKEHTVQASFARREQAVATGSGSSTVQATATRKRPHPDQPAASATGPYHCDKGCALWTTQHLGQLTRHYTVKHANHALPQNPIIDTPVPHQTQSIRDDCDKETSIDEDHTCTTCGRQVGGLESVLHTNETCHRWPQLSGLSTWPVMTPANGRTNAVAAVFTCTFAHAASWPAIT
jgi:hypothetical protein